MEDSKSKAQKIYTLAPSEFNFLMKCAHCYWKKHNAKLQNKGTFPGVFSLFDMRQKEYFNTLKTKDITPITITKIFCEAHITQPAASAGG